MARFAIIEGDEVINVIVADVEFIKESKIDAIECAENVCVGWQYIDGEFIAPTPITSTES